MAQKMLQTILIVTALVSVLFIEAGFSDRGPSACFPQSADGVKGKYDELCGEMVRYEVLYKCFKATTSYDVVSRRIVRKIAEYEDVLNRKRQLVKEFANLHKLPPCDGDLSEVKLKAQSEAITTYQRLSTKDSYMHPFICIVT